MTSVIVGNYCLGSLEQQVECDFPDQKGRTFAEVFKKTGVRVRHVKSTEENVLTLAIKASEPVVKKVGNSNVDCLVFVTQSPESLLPATSFSLHKALNLPKECPVFDLPHGCSGFVYGLLLGESFVKTGKSKSFLVVTSETYSKYIRPDDPTTRPIFSDGAAALFFPADRQPEVLSSVFFTDGGGAKELCLIRDEKSGEKNHLFMNGINVFAFTMSAVPRAAAQLFENAQLEINDVDCFIFHQASAIVLEQIQKTLNIPDAKMFRCLENIGNTVSASIPIALIEAERQGKVKRGSKVLLMGFGVGLSLCGAIVVFQ